MIKRWRLFGLVVGWSLWSGGAVLLAQEADADGDGFAGATDACPAEAAAFSVDGCSVAGLPAPEFQDDPLLYVDGLQIWTYTPLEGAAALSTALDTGTLPQRSPDGTHWAWNTLTTAQAPDPAVDLSDPFQFRLGEVWLWTFGTAPRLLVGQPAGATLQDGLVRSDAAWSPDGTQLAWTQLLLPDYRYQLVVYDLASETERVLVEALPSGFQDVVFAVRQPLWGARGLAIERVEFGEAGPADLLTLYDPAEGALLAELVISQGEVGALDVVWLQHQPGQMAVALTNNTWQALDPLTGAWGERGTPYLASPGSADAVGTHLVLVPEVVFGLNYRWVAYNAAGLAVGAFDTLSLGDVALAPAGRGLAYLDGEQLWLDLGAGGGTGPHTLLNPAPFPDGLTWAPLAWYWA
ncbi:hypothetical protein HC928_15240, partial [bacterium]|nr:hypothetical protein [bacterium]